jgi:hypothetical protein
VRGDAAQKVLIIRKTALLATATVIVLGGGIVGHANDGFRRVREFLTGYQQVPVISTTGHGSFDAVIDETAEEIRYVLRYADLEGTITQSHIHFAAPNNTGQIVVFLCSNLGNGPAGTPTCPTPPLDGEVEGTLTPAAVLGNAAAQGIEAGSFGELIGAIRNGATYVNIYSSKWPAGEVRSQIQHDHSGPDRH